MRKHMLGSSPMAGSWSPRFARSTAARKDGAAIDRSPREVSRFTTIKNGRRSIPLYDRVHIKLAYLLEADSAVLHWNTAEAARSDDMLLPDTVEFLARLVDGYQAIRVGDPFPEEDAASLTIRGFTLYEVRRSKLLLDQRVPTAETLIYYRSQPLPAGFVMAAILALSHRTPPQTLGQLQEQLGQFEPAWEQILTLVGTGHVQITLAATIDLATRITGMNEEGWR